MGWPRLFKTESLCLFKKQDSWWFGKFRDGSYLKKQEDFRNSLVLLGVTQLWHVLQWVARAPPHHTLSAFLNLNGIKFQLNYRELLHPTLQECLTILTELYGQIRASSIFSGKESNMNKNQTAEELLELVPEFAQKLSQRGLALALSRKVFIKNSFLIKIAYLS